MSRDRATGRYNSSSSSCSATLSPIKSRRYVDTSSSSIYLSLSPFFRLLLAFFSDLIPAQNDWPFCLVVLYLKRSSIVCRAETKWLIKRPNSDRERGERERPISIYIHLYVCVCCVYIESQTVWIVHVNWTIYDPPGRLWWCQRILLLSMMATTTPTPTTIYIIRSDGGAGNSLVVLNVFSSAGHIYRRLASATHKNERK